MTGITLDESRRQLGMWLRASEAVSQNQSYSIATESGSRALTRTDASEIRQQILFWDRQINRLSRTGISARGVFIDGICQWSCRVNF